MKNFIYRCPLCNDLIKHEKWTGSQPAHAIDDHEDVEICNNCNTEILIPLYPIAKVTVEEDFK
jgi:hypothetical protein